MPAELQYRRGVLWDNEIVWWACPDCGEEGQEHHRMVGDRGVNMRAATEEQERHNHARHPEPGAHPYDRQEAISKR